MNSFEKLYIKYGISSVKLKVENTNTPFYDVNFLNGEILKICISKSIKTENDILILLENDLKKHLNKIRKAKINEIKN